MVYPIGILFMKEDGEMNFFLHSALLGVGLAMDAFSVSLANGLREPKMDLTRMGNIAGTFGLFQAVMPLAGWLCVHTVASYFAAFQMLIPWIALILLAYIGGKMLLEGFSSHGEEEEVPVLGGKALLLQGVATSIDALSVGFTISDYTLPMAMGASLIIAVVTFVICMAGLALGKRFGTRLAGRASILGGCILIFIGLNTFVGGIFG